MRRQQIQAGAGVRERAVREAGVEGAEGARGRPVLDLRVRPRCRFRKSGTEYVK
jgi:hypothetical protein